MEDDVESYGHLSQNLEYDDDLNNLFKNMSGYFFDKKTKKIIKIKNFKPIMEEYCVNSYMDRTIKALTNITMLSNNTDKIIAYKSVSVMRDYWDLTQSLVCEEKHKLLRRLANDRLGELKSIIIGLTMVVDDAYRRSRNMKTADLIFKQHQVSESITTSKGNKKTGFMANLKPSTQEEEE